MGMLDHSMRLQHPVVLQQLEERHKNFQIRLADGITAFAGSLSFVYIHAIVFALWMVLLDEDPWPKLTLVVSLEAIFLSTFMMIGQNRQAAFQQAKAKSRFPGGRIGAQDEYFAYPRNRGTHEKDRWDNQ